MNNARKNPPLVGNRLTIRTFEKFGVIIIFGL